jgi:DNA polymerase
VSYLADALAILRQQGVVLSTDGVDLIWEANREPTDAEASWLRANKSALIRELNCLRLDIETISPLDLTQVGTANYATHPETRLLMLAWCVGTDPVQVWWPGQPVPRKIAATIGWNAVNVSHGPFDRIVWETKLVPLGWPRVPSERWSDTSARCRAYRVPARLEKAAERLELGCRKDPAGIRLIRRATEAARGGAPLTAGELEQFNVYAAQDVEVLREIDRRVPELSDSDSIAYQLNARINERGLPIDLDRVRGLAAVLEPENQRLTERMQSLVGLNPTQDRRLLVLLEQIAVNRPVNMQGETLQWWLANDAAGGTARAVVETRLEYANSAGTKLNKMLAIASPDGRVRGCFLWHGAHTGRWSGRGFQPQNLPRMPKGFDFATVLAGLLRDRGPVRGVDIPGMEACKASVNRSVKSRIGLCLRGMVKAPDGQLLVVCDFSQIESRVLCWLAGQENMLDLYRRGEDPYIVTANALGSNDRQFGKLLVLAAGFGGGPRMLLAKAPSYDVQLTEVEAERAIAAWRSANPAIVSFWNALHQTLRDVAGGPVGTSALVGSKFPRNLLTVSREADDTLRVQLPSGRSLIYHQPRLVPDDEFEWRYDLVCQQAAPGDWREMTAWRGLVAENVVQAVAYDIMIAAMLRMDAIGVELIGSVHDEIVALAPTDEADAVLSEMRAIMSAPPTWADGLPLAAEGYHNVRYAKP